MAAASGRCPGVAATSGRCLRVPAASGRCLQRGLVAASDAPGTATVKLPFDEKLTQLYGGTHGGALLSLADAAISIALATTFEGEERTATVEISMHFMAKAGKDDIEASATCMSPE